MSNKNINSNVIDPQLGNIDSIIVDDSSPPINITEPGQDQGQPVSIGDLSSIDMPISAYGDMENRDYSGEGNDNIDYSDVADYLNSQDENAGASPQNSVTENAADLDNKVASTAESGVPTPSSSAEVPETKAESPVIEMQGLGSNVVIDNSPSPSPSPKVNKKEQEKKLPGENAPKNKNDEKTKMSKIDQYIKDNFNPNDISVTAAELKEIKQNPVHEPSDNLKKLLELKERSLSLMQNEKPDDMQVLADMAALQKAELYLKELQGKENEELYEKMMATIALNSKNKVFEEDEPKKVTVDAGVDYLAQLHKELIENEDYKSIVDKVEARINDLKISGDLKGAKYSTDLISQINQDPDALYALKVSKAHIYDVQMDGKTTDQKQTAFRKALTQSKTSVMAFLGSPNTKLALSTVGFVSACAALTLGGGLPLLMATPRLIAAISDHKGASEIFRKFEDKIVVVSAKHGVDVKPAFGFLNKAKDAAVALAKSKGFMMLGVSSLAIAGIAGIAALATSEIGGSIAEATREVLESATVSADGLAEGTTATVSETSDLVSTTDSVSTIVSEAIDRTMETIPDHIAEATELAEDPANRYVASLADQQVESSFTSGYSAGHDVPDGIDGIDGDVDGQEFANNNSSDHRQTENSSLDGSGELDADTASKDAPEVAGTEKVTPVEPEVEGAEKVTQVEPVEGGAEQVAPVEPEVAGAEKVAPVEPEDVGAEDVPQIIEVEVKSGRTAWGIAEKAYQDATGNAPTSQQIVAIVNDMGLDNPEMIQPGDTVNISADMGKYDLETLGKVDADWLEPVVEQSQNLDGIVDGQFPDQVNVAVHYKEVMNENWNSFSEFTELNENKTFSPGGEYITADGTEVTMPTLSEALSDRVFQGNTPAFLDKSALLEIIAKENPGVNLSENWLFEDSSIIMNMPETLSSSTVDMGGFLPSNTEFSVSGSGHHMRYEIMKEAFGGEIPELLDQSAFMDALKEANPGLGHDLLSGNRNYMTVDITIPEEMINAMSGIAPSVEVEQVVSKTVGTGMNKDVLSKIIAASKEAAKDGGLSS